MSNAKSKFDSRFVEVVQPEVGQRKRFHRSLALSSAIYCVVVVDDIIKDMRTRKSKNAQVEGSNRPCHERLLAAKIIEDGLIERVSCIFIS